MSWNTHPPTNAIANAIHPVVVPSAAITWAAHSSGSTPAIVSTASGTSSSRYQIVTIATNTIAPVIATLPICRRSHDRGISSASTINGTPMKCVILLRSFR